MRGKHQVSMLDASDFQRSLAALYRLAKVLGYDLDTYRNGPVNVGDTEADLLLLESTLEQYVPCSSGCLPTGNGFAHLRTIDRAQANIRLTPTIPCVYCIDIERPGGADNTPGPIRTERRFR